MAEAPPKETEAQAEIKPWLSRCSKGVEGTKLCEDRMEEAEVKEEVEAETKTGETELDTPENVAQGKNPSFADQRQKLWHLFQSSALTLAHLYSDTEDPHQGISLWDPFREAAGAVSRLYKESSEAHRRSFELGVQEGCQRRAEDVLEWVTQGGDTILREDLIAFLCGKINPKVPPKAEQSSAASSTVNIDLQPFHQALTLHGLGSITGDAGAGAATSISLCLDSGNHSNSSPHEDGNGDNSSKAISQLLDSVGTRKRQSTEHSEGASPPLNELPSSSNPKRTRKV